MQVAASISVATFTNAEELDLTGGTRRGSEAAGHQHDGHYWALACKDHLSNVFIDTLRCSAFFLLSLKFPRTSLQLIEFGGAELLCIHQQIQHAAAEHKE